jgi:hypothetical protein
MCNIVYSIAGSLALVINTIAGQLNRKVGMILPLQVLNMITVTT